MSWTNVDLDLGILCSIAILSYLMWGLGIGFAFFGGIIKTEDLFRLTVSLLAEVRSFIFVNALLILISSKDGLLLRNSRHESSANNLKSKLKERGKSLIYLYTKSIRGPITLISI